MSGVEPSPAAAPAEAAVPADPRWTWRLTLYLGLAVVAVLVVVVAVALSFATKPKPAFDYVVIIPKGTAEQVGYGVETKLMPHNVSLEVHDRLVVENRDVVPHTVGPFTVRPGERSTYRFDEPGRYVGGCTIDPSGKITIVVT